MPEKFSENVLQTLLPVYYKRLFPSYLMCKWLGYSAVQKDYFHRREWSFTLKDDIYLRYQTFNDSNEFESNLVKKCPFKIDIGGVYSHVPKDNKNWNGGVLQVEERELVFDIDMTDYDDVRFCCSAANICNDCWPLMQFAIKIVDRVLEEDFGFVHKMWIYSGRRGVHCWVGDEAARKLNSQARQSIAEYLTVVKGGDSHAKKVNLPYNLHPSLRRAARVVQRGFDDYACNKQDFLGDDTKVAKLLSLMPSECRDDLNEKMKKGKNSLEKWQIFQACTKQLQSKKYKLSPNIIDEIMFQYVYPRLDTEVTKGVNHLLKSPFCIHPKTGRVCVPIDTDRIDQFDPFKVPTLEELCGQLERCDLINMDKKIKDYKKTDMRVYIEQFEKFIGKMEKTWKVNNMLQSDLKGMEGDF